LACSFAALGLGSNLGDSRSIILEAVKALREILQELRCASLYETEPMYEKDQGSFINTVVTGYYGGDDHLSELEGQPESARRLLKRLHEMEERFGRNRAREKRWGERFLDIDILLFGNLTLSEASLIIPHPRLKERRFALEPLLEILPDAVEPVTGLYYRDLCSRLPEQGVKRLSNHSILSEAPR